MKYLLSLILVVAIYFFVGVGNTEALVRVRSYFRRNGTYVAPHYRTDPNSYKFDNWSYRGNINPFTGRRGYRW